MGVVMGLLRRKVEARGEASVRAARQRPSRAEPIAISSIRNTLRRESIAAWRHQVPCINLPKRFGRAAAGGGGRLQKCACVPAAKATEMVKLQTGARPQSA